MRFCKLPACAVFGATVALALSPIAAGQSRMEPGYSSAATERLVQAYERRFSASARGRLEDWKRFAAERHGTASARELALVESVNEFVNRLRFVDDQVHWNAADYWATPAESNASGGADCEDYAIAKYFLLRELGLPAARLRMVYVRAQRLAQAHMVLAYYPRPEAEPLVLDNLDPRLRPATERSDLVPVYSFNDESVWVEAGGRVGSPAQIRNWSAVLARLGEEWVLAGFARRTP